MKLNMKKFISGLKSVKVDIEDIQLEGGVQYLYRIMTQTVFAENPISIKDIDFDSFSLDDLDAFEKLFSDKIECQIYDVGNVVDCLCSAKPIFKVSKSFF